MWQDPIVEQVRKHRREYAAQFNHDLAEICRDLRKRQSELGRQVVSLPPKLVKPSSSEDQPAV